tara:strand:- start:3923 stop:4615 length:693 start_codon:yes stop_codon:yes gene_type:complete
MERGVALESDALDQFITDFDMHMTPCCVESEEYTFLGASLDGISDCGKFLVEIKCNGKKNHDLALKGIIPPHYFGQIQHQLLVTNAEKGYYYSYDGEKGVCIEVSPDPKWVEDYLPKVRKFWKCVVFFEPPPLSESDYKDMGDSLAWSDYAYQYTQIDAEIKAAENKKDYLRKKLIELCGDDNCKGAGVKVLKSVTSGRVQYDDIPELKNVNLDKYRKEATTSWRITLEK